MVITCMMLASDPLISTWHISEMKPGASIENDPEKPVRNLDDDWSVMVTQWLLIGHLPAEVDEPHTVGEDETKPAGEYWH